MRTGFSCLDKETGLQLADEWCGYDLTRTYNVSRHVQELPHEMFGIEYGAGVTSGAMAFEEATVAGVSIQRTHCSRQYVDAHVRRRQFRPLGVGSWSLKLIIRYDLRETCHILSTWV